MEEQSYYQKNKEIILAKRKLKRQFEKEERLRLGRPFMVFDDDADITFESSMNEILEGEITIEPLKPLKPLEPIVENIVIQPIGEPIIVKPIGEPVVEKKKKVKKSKK